MTEITPIKPGIVVRHGEGSVTVSHASVTGSGVSIPIKTRAQRIAQMLADARDEALDDTGALITGLEMVAMHAGGIGEAEGGYPPGVPDLARRIAERMRADADTLRAILGRVTS